MRLRTIIVLLAVGGAAALAQTIPEPPNEVQMIVTAADHMNHRPAPLEPATLRIRDATITGVIPIEGGEGLDLFIVIDDAADYNFGSKLSELRKFVMAQPAAVSVGVAYIAGGTLRIAEDPTTDHVRAASSLRSPAGNRAANSYCALSSLMQQWSGKSLRREIVLVSNGIDDSARGVPVCVNADAAILDAERAGVVIYALYNPASHYTSEKWSEVDTGLVDLAHLCYETGGEAYFVGHDPASSIEPFLADIGEHLAHQYLVKFRMTPHSEGGFETIYIDSPPSIDQELMKPDRVWIPRATGGWSMELHRK